MRVRASRRLAVSESYAHLVMMFQHTAARRRLGAVKESELVLTSVSTHSRPKAAGLLIYHTFVRERVSTHSRPKAAGYKPFMRFHYVGVSTHSRPKAAGPLPFRLPHPQNRFNTQPPEGGWACNTACCNSTSWFQHTAARRRLAGSCFINSSNGLFQHTAARRRLGPMSCSFCKNRSFNTQPPEGGWPNTIIKV